MKGNQYGRTTFFLAGVPGMQLPVSFVKADKSDGALSIYEQVYNASIFSMYLPVANVADFKNAMQGRNYKGTEFYHTLLMSNHNESDPWQFADGIRGKVLWHNEYRMQGMYTKKSSPVFRDRMFAAAFNPASAKAPFHNETCDGCHVRNGSGIPINTDLKLDKLLQEFMTAAEYNPSKDGVQPQTRGAMPTRLNENIFCIRRSCFGELATWLVSLSSARDPRRNPAGSALRSGGECRRLCAAFAGLGRDDLRRLDLRRRAGRRGGIDPPQDSHQADDIAARDDSHQAAPGDDGELTVSSITKQPRHFGRIGLR